MFVRERERTESGGYHVARDRGRANEREGVCVRERGCVCVWERERGCVREREGVCE